MYFGPALHSTQQYQLPSGFPTAPAEPTGHTDMASIWDTFRRRKRVFWAVFVGFFSLVVLWTAVVPKEYIATIKLIAGSSSVTATRGADTTLPLLNALIAATNTNSAETYVDLIQEAPVAEQVIRNLHLPIDVYDLMNDHVTVAPVTNTNIIELSAMWHNDQTAIKLANEFGTVFVQRQRDLISGQAGSALDFLAKQMPVAQAAMNREDNALARFEAAHPNVYVASGSGNAGGDSAVLAAQQKFAVVQVDQEQAQAQLSSVSAQMRSITPTINGQSNVIENPVTAQLRAQLAQVEVQLADARKLYTEAHPTVQALKEQEAQLQREIGGQAATIVAENNIVPNPVYQQLSQQAATLRSQIAGDQAQIRALGAELGRAGGSLNSLPAQVSELTNLQRNAKMAEDIYAALQQKYGEATVAQTTALSDVAVTQPASWDSMSVKPSWKINLALGLVLGLVMAVSGVFLVDFLDNTFKNEEDVQRALPLPLLTSIPQLSARTARKLPWSRASAQGKLPWLRAVTIESFLQLVTALRYSSDKPLRTLVITSPNQGDGKTTVAMSTAIAMAEMEPKVLLIDADLRRPNAHERMGLAAEPGLSEILVGQISIRDAIQPTKYDGLYLLSGGRMVPNPVKLIHSPRFDELIAELLEEYRALVFDTPALLPVHDGAILGAKVDGTVLVVAAGITDMPSTKKALQRLSSVQGVNILGVVLNRATPTNGYSAYYLNTDSPTPLPHEDGVTSQA
jgi:capsular exopolysaccharide synthesis family protein